MFLIALNRTPVTPPLSYNKLIIKLPAASGEVSNLKKQNFLIYVASDGVLNPCYPINGITYDNLLLQNRTVLHPMVDQSSKITSRIQFIIETVDTVFSTFCYLVVPLGHIHCRKINHLEFFNRETTAIRVFRRTPIIDALPLIL